VIEEISYTYWITKHMHFTVASEEMMAYQRIEYLTELKATDGLSWQALREIANPKNLE